MTPRLGEVLVTAAHVWVCAALFFTLLLLGGVWRLRRRPPPPPPPVWPPIALLRPCEGAEPDLSFNLWSSLRAQYDGPRRVLFLVPDRADPAYAVAAAVAQAAAAQGLAAAVVLTAPAPRQNRKVAQLVAGLKGCSEEVVVIIDSDVRLGDADLPALVAALAADPQRAAAFASPVETAPQTLWDRVSAALVGGSPQNFLALYGLYGLLGGVPSMAGALCALRRQALLRAGGFGELLNFLGEDYELARRFTALHYQIAISREPARCRDGGRSLGEVVARVARWLTVVRSQRPLLLLTYPVFVAPTPALLLAAALCWRSTLWLYAAALLGLRMLLTVVLRRTQGLHRGPLAAAAEVLGAEVLLWLGLGRALTTRRISWRGHRFRIGRGGCMLADEPPLGAPAARGAVPPVAPTARPHHPSPG
jgi:ceramide glucosyltransferase